VKQKILAFCLRHWKEIGLVLLLLVVFGKSQYDMRNVIKAHEVSEQSLKTQIETLQSLHADELELRDEALERYRRDIEELEQQYEERQAEIANLTRAEKEVIIKEFKQDKALIAQRFIETYGLNYVE
tara:strand:- start:706 stop:1086 length:381 start_codon:yes stop_codon:yes gene_type:complete